MPDKIIHIIGRGPSKDLFQPDGNEIMLLNGNALRTIPNPEYIVVVDHKVLDPINADKDEIELLMASRPKVFFAHKTDWSDHPAFRHIPNPIDEQVDGYNTCLHAGILVARNILKADIIVCWIDFTGDCWEHRWYSDLGPFFTQLKKECDAYECSLYCGSEKSMLSQIMPVWQQTNFK